MYRPEGMKKNPYVECIECKYEPDTCSMDYCEGDKDEHKAFELGADAMLEGLKGDQYIDCGKLSRDTIGVVLNDIPPKFKLRRDFKGWIVFIPEGEE